MFFSQNLTLKVNVKKKEEEEERVLVYIFSIIILTFLELFFSARYSIIRNAHVLKLLRQSTRSISFCKK